MSTLKVSFPSAINIASLEPLLLEHLTKSRSQAVDLVRFDLSQVQWVDLYSSSLIAIWIDDLKDKGKKIEFVYPLCELTGNEKRAHSTEKAEEILRRRMDVCTNFNRWGIDLFLQSRMAFIEGYDQDYRYLPYDPENTELLPLKLFESYENFKDFLSNLRDSNQYEFVFKDTVSLSVIGGGGIRDTIIRELGDNIFDHGKGKCGFIIICRHQAPANQSVSAARYRAATDLDKPFFRALGQSGYIELVVADHGPGIFRTLKESYIKDLKVPEESKVSPKEAAVIAYAFEKYSTSKFNANLIFEREEDDPGRGLFWVRELALENKCLFTVRSGASLIQFDFLTGANKFFYKTNKDSKLLSRLANLGGTQIKLYLPITPEVITHPVVSTRRTLQADESKKSVKLKYLVFELHDFVAPDGGWAVESSDSLLNALPGPDRSINEVTISILDFTEVSFDKNVLFPLLLKFAELQHIGVNIVCLYPEYDPQLLNIASDELAERIQRHTLKLKPILLVTETGFEVLGLSAGDYSTLKNSLSKLEAPIDISVAQYREFVRRNNHLFDFNQREQKPILKLDVSEIRKRLAEHYKHGLAQVIIDETSGIFYTGKFVLPSHSYVEGYFRINTILSFETYRRRIVYIINDFLSRLEETPDFIVTVSNDIKEIGHELVTHLKAHNNPPVEHLHIDDARNRDRNAGLFLVRLLSKKIVILNSVIGTGKLLEAVLDICQEPSYKIEVLSIFSVIDARDQNRARQLNRDIDPNAVKYKDHSYSLESIFQHPLSFHDERPPRWRREDIRRIDPVTNAPDLDHPQPATEPLWGSIDEVFLRRIIKRSGALDIGHFIRRHRHYIYYFDMALIAKSVGEEIAEKIEKDVSALSYERLSESNSSSPELTYNNHNMACVIYDQRSRGAKIVAEHIASGFIRPRPKVYSIQEFKNAKPLIKESIRNKNLIIFSNAVFRGEHLQHLIDDVSDLSPHQMFIYAVIHRKESDSIPFYQKIESYSGEEVIGVRVRYFVEVEIPVFTAWDCPVCNRVKELRDIKDGCENSILEEFLKEELESLAPKPILDLEETQPTSSINLEEVVNQTNLRWHVGLAKTNLPPRYVLSDIVQSHDKNPDETLRLLEVMAREISFLKSYEELFYPVFCAHLKNACVSLLERCQDEYQREKSAIIILRQIDPSGLVNNLVNIFKGVSQNETLINYLFVELLGIIKEQKISIEHVAAALDLCQKALEWDEHFVGFSIEDLTRLQNLLSYVRRELRIEAVRVRVTNRPLEAVVARLYNAFVHTPRGVHPKLLSHFSLLTGIHSAESFRQLYKAYYDGAGNVAEIVEEILPTLNEFTVCLRPEIKDYLNYFLTKGKGSFSDDWKIFDDSFRSMATLDAQGRLTDADVESLFFYNPEVNTSIDRLNNYAFKEDSSLIREVLISKFTRLSTVIEGIAARWEERFRDRGIETTYKSRTTEVFIARPVIDDVLDSLLQNIYRHAFDLSSTNKRMNLIVDQEVGNILINVRDTGRGISKEDLEHRPHGGIKRVEKLIAPYQGSIHIKTIQQKDSEGYATVIEIKLLSKEMILSCLENYS